MGAVQLPDGFRRVTECQVAAGRATSMAVFLEAAVLRPIDDARLEDEEPRGASQAGIADVAAGRCTTMGSAGDAERIQVRLMARLRACLSAEE